MFHSNTTARISGLSGDILNIADPAYAGSYHLGSQHRQKNKRTTKAVSNMETSQEAPGADMDLGKHCLWGSSGQEYVIHPAPLHYRSLHHLKHQLLRGSQNYCSLIHVSPATREDLEWWLHEVSIWNGRSLQANSPEWEIEMDASQTGWGAYCQGNLTGGWWSEEEQSLHINELELLAALLTLRTFLKHVRDVSILVKSDKVAVAYINHLGGIKSCVLVRISK